jgi:hypothetical protein
VERKADPITVENTVKKAGRIVVQAGTINGDINAPANCRADGTSHRLVGILACALVALCGVVVLQARPDPVADNAPTTITVTQTSTVTVAPTTTITSSIGGYLPFY